MGVRKYVCPVCDGERGKQHGFCGCWLDDDYVEGEERSLT